MGLSTPSPGCRWRGVAWRGVAWERTSALQPHKWCVRVVGLLGAQALASKRLSRTGKWFHALAGSC